MAETCTEVELGLMATEMGGGAAVTVIVDDPDFVVSAMDVALSVTAAGLGVAAGAL